MSGKRDGDFDLIFAVDSAAHAFIAADGARRRARYRPPGAARRAGAAARRRPEPAADHRRHDPARARPPRRRRPAAGRARGRSACRQAGAGRGGAPRIARRRRPHAAAAGHAWPPPAGSVLADRAGRRRQRARPPARQRLPAGRRARLHRDRARHPAGRRTAGQHQPLRRHGADPGLPPRPRGHCAPAPERRHRRRPRQAPGLDGAARGGDPGRWRSRPPADRAPAAGPPRPAQPGRPRRRHAAAARASPGLQGHRRAAARRGRADVRIFKKNRRSSA